MLLWYDVTLSEVIFIFVMLWKPFSPHWHERQGTPSLAAGAGMTSPHLAADQKAKGAGTEPEAGTTFKDRCPSYGFHCYDEKT